MNISKLLIVFIFSCLVFTSKIFAQDKFFIVGVDPVLGMLGENTSYKLRIDDQIENGCWASPSTALTKAELDIINNKFGRLASGDNPGIDIFLTGYGYRHGENGLCVASLSLKVYLWSTQRLATEGHELISVYKYPAFQTNLILSGPQETMNNRIADSFSTMIGEFIVYVNKEKESIRLEIEKANIPDDEKVQWKVYFNIE